MKRQYVAALALIAVVLVILISLLYKNRILTTTNYLGHHVSPTPLGQYSQAAVVSDAEQCAAIGRQLLEKNGTAMDAAIGTLFCMGVVIPQSMGLGGGCFITFYNSTSRKATVIDGRESAPLASSENMYDGNLTLAQRGPLAIAVPGELAAYAEGHRLFGRLSWADLTKGAERLAEQGFRVGKHFESSLKRWEDTIPKYNVKDVILKQNGDPFVEGDTLKRPDLARTLRRIVNEGPDSFYSGNIMKDMVQDLKQLGSILTEQDFRLYKPRVYDALSINLTGSSSTMYGVRPPGSGVILGFILNIMSGYKDLYPDKSKKSPEQASLFYHRLVEAFKYAYAKRTELGDEVFDDIAHLMDSLTDPKFVDTIRKTIDDDKTFETDHYGSIYHARDDHGTAHVSVIDAQGNAVSVTTTVNLYFGSMVISPKTGILFNDQMDDFAVPGVTNFFGLPPSAANRIKPQKRPLSSMCPTIVVDNHSGKVKLAVGGAGGTKITTAASIVALRNLLFGESIKEAIDAPRLHHQLNPNQVVYDEGFPEHVLVELARKGHKVVPLSGRASVIIGIARTQDGALQAAYDYKKNGSVDGY